MEEILKKIKNAGILEDNEYFDLESAVKWGINNGYEEKPFSVTDLQVKEKEEAEKTIRAFLDVTPSILTEEKPSDYYINNMECKTNHRSTKGRVFSENSSAIIRGKNILIEYPSETPKTKIEETLAYKLKDAAISEVKDHTYSVYRPYAMSIKSLKAYKIGNSVPTIRSFSNEMLADSLKKVDQEVGGVILKNFLDNPCPENVAELENTLKISLSSVNVLYHSEFILSCVFFNYVHCLGIKTSWKKTQVLSVDSKMQDLSVENDGSVFRCDMLFVYEDCLCVVEFKYKYERPENMAEEAMKCIREKEYVRKSSEFLQLNYPSIFKGIKRVLAIGAGYNIHNGLIKINLKHASSVISSLDEVELNRRQKSLITITNSRDFLKNKRRREKRQQVSFIIYYKNRKKWREDQ